MKYGLDVHWKLRYEMLNWEKTMAPVVLAKSDGWMDVQLPCDIHLPLIANGIIQEPLVGKNSFECKWIEEKSWWFMRSVDISHDMLSNDVVDLVLDGLDSEADIFLNGMFMDRHRSSHYPYRKDVKEYLNVGENTLLVRLTTGYEYVSEKDIQGLKGEVLYCGGRGDRRRAFIRKPQFVCGWDWAPHLLTCGITRGAYLETLSDVTVRDFHVVTKQISPTALLDISIEVENMNMIATNEIIYGVVICLDGKIIASTVTEKTVVTSGVNYFDVPLTIENPELWWPNGYGRQPLYDIKVWIGEENSSNCRTIKYGIRKIRINQDKLDQENRKFALNVNEVDIFCRGGNWIPADSIYARVSDEKYATLIDEAKSQNFTMLRVWGGGLFEPDIFYRKCDEEGILLWHDFMYACSLYPEYLEWFINESQREADYQTKRLRNHACLALWCGNNEMQWIFSEENQIGEDFMKKTCNKLFNRIIPETIHENCPNIPYWNSSPYGGSEATSEQMGDTHIWPRRNRREIKLHAYETFDLSKSKFMSEYGYVGPCKLKSVMEYCGIDHLYQDGEVYKYHSHYPEEQFGQNIWHEGMITYYKDAKDISFHEYLLYGGLTHGAVLQYSLESFRSQLYCNGALLWMYNDAWGEDGWTTVDYYLRRKIAYYFVKRALAPTKLILKKTENVVQITGINETPEEVNLDLEYGYQKFDGSGIDCKKESICLGAFSRQVVIEFDASSRDLVNGICYALPIGNGTISSEILHALYPRQLKLEESNQDIMDFKRFGDTISFKITTDKFAHAVHFDLDADIHLSDDYFDLLPNETKEILICNAQHLTIDDIKPMCTLMQ